MSFVMYFHYRMSENIPQVHRSITVNLKNGFTAIKTTLVISLLAQSCHTYLILLLISNPVIFLKCTGNMEHLYRSS